jgi:hypothetical protein
MENRVLKNFTFASIFGLDFWSGLISADIRVGNFEGSTKSGRCAGNAFTIEPPAVRYH